MATFILRRKLDLGELGEDWKECFVTLRDMTVEEVQRFVPSIAKTEDGSKEQMDMIGEIISNCFVEGKGFDGSKVIEIKKEDLGNLPLKVYLKCFDFLVEGSSAK